MTIGVAGAPSWTLAAEATAISLVGGLISSAAQKQGAQGLKNAQQAIEELLVGTGDFCGEFFPCQNIKNISLPHPQAWSASKGSTRYVDVGDDFVWVMMSGRPVAIQWLSVQAVSAG